MDRNVLELLANAHGVQFDEKTSDEDLQKALTDAIKAKSEANDGGTTPPVAVPPAPAPNANAVPPAVLNELKKQAKDDTYLAAVLAELEAQRQQVAELQVANRLQEVRRKLADVGNARRVLTPHVNQKLTELIAAMPPKAGDKVIDVVKEILSDGGTVELGERGRAAVDNNRDAAAQFESEVAKLQEADSKISYADAVTAVASTHPQLFSEYRRSATSEWR